MRVIHVIRKTGIVPISRNVIEWGTGAINVDASRLPTTETWEGRVTDSPPSVALSGGADGSLNNRSSDSHPYGRFPTNVILHGTADGVDAQSGERPGGNFPKQRTPNQIYGGGKGTSLVQIGAGRDLRDTGGASRFFKVLE